MMDARHQQPITPPMSYAAADQPPPPPSSSSSRPTLGFPLGTALLLIVIFSLSGMFSCCYHWDKLQSLRRRALLGRARRQPDDEESASHADGAAPQGVQSPPSKPGALDQCAKQERSESLPVIMPGDQIPKFIAWPCPCDHLPSPVAAPPLRASDLLPPPPPQDYKLAAVSPDDQERRRRSPPSTPPAPEPAVPS